MTTEVGHTAVSVFPSAKGFAGKLQGEVGPQVDKVGKDAGGRMSKGILGGLGGVKAGVAGLLAGAAVGSFLSGAIAEARESQKVSALSAQVIKTTGAAAHVTAGQVGALSTAISNKTGIDDEAIQSGANLLLTFTNVRNEVGKGNDVFNQATSVITDMGAALGGDPKSSAIQLGKALNDPVKGITALSRVGVSFTAEQKKQVAGLVAHNNVLGAQKIILAEVNREFGGAAAAQATAGDKAKVAFGNLKEAVGTALLPALDAVATFATTRVIPALYTLGGFLRDTLGPIFRFVGQQVHDFIAGLQGVGPVTDGVFTAVRQIGLGIRAMILAFQDGDVTSDGLVGTFERLGVFAKTQLVPAIALIVQHVRANVIPTLRAFAGFVATNVVPVLRALAAFIISTVIPAAVRIGGIVAGTLQRGFALLSQKIAENRPQLIQIGNVLRTVAGFIVTNVLPIVARLASFLAGTLFFAIGKAIGIIGGIVTVITKMVDGVRSAIEFFERLADKIKHLPKPPGLGLLGKIPGFAAGGTLPAGFSLTGERGPELVYSPRGGERVTTAAATRALLAAPAPLASGDGIAQTNHFYDIPAESAIRQANRELLFAVATG